MNLNNSEFIFWHKYLKTLNTPLENVFVESKIAGDSKIMELFLIGKKLSASGLI